MICLSQPVLEATELQISQRLSQATYSKPERLPQLAVEMENHKTIK